MRRFKTVLLRFTFSDFDKLKAEKGRETWEDYILKLSERREGLKIDRN